jgi:hypothetical protein
MDRYPVTVTLSALGAGTTDFPSKKMNGLICGVYVAISKEIGANGKVTITGESTQKAILTVANPSTLGAWYYPQVAIQGTTANTLSSTVLRTKIPLYMESPRVKVASSSGLEGETVSVNIYV